jgi:hypothetical protein
MIMTKSRLPNEDAAQRKLHGAKQILVQQECLEAPVWP